MCYARAQQNGEDYLLDDLFLGLQLHVAVLIVMDVNAERTLDISSLRINFPEKVRERKEKFNSDLIK